MLNVIVILNHLKFIETQVELFNFLLGYMAFRPKPYKRIYNTIFPTLRSNRKEFHLDAITKIDLKKKTSPYTISNKLPHSLR